VISRNNPSWEFPNRLREVAFRSLERMYLPEKRIFVFRLRKEKERIIPEGISARYTAIALIGLAGEESKSVSTVLHGHGPEDVCRRLVEDIHASKNLGDVALSLWALNSFGHEGRQIVYSRLAELNPDEAGYPVVELSWALTALCLDREESVVPLRDRIAGRLMGSFGKKSGIFPHLLGGKSGGARSHVSCFADMVYPIQALSHYHRVAGNSEALDVAARCAERICCLQGDAGQWWWHYDYRTGEVIERYPVYAIHQDAMGPMALFALKDAKGPYFEKELRLGMEWLERSPELEGNSLVDPEADIVWRKVARREPGKTSRFLQAAASRIHPALRVPGLDKLFPPLSVDYEDRPYHLGWLLHAWPASRVLSGNSVETDQ